MFEKEPQISERVFSLEHWAESQALDFIIQNTRAKPLKMEDGDFIGLYGENEITKDRIITEALKRKFADGLRGLPESERKREELSLRRGKALEIIIAEQGELSDWFGPNAMTTRTTEIDDFKNKVDLVVEFSSEKKSRRAAKADMERIALAVDALDYPAGVGDKMRINLDRLTGKRPPAHVKYFRSQATDYVGPIDKIIPVVVGLEGKNMRDLVRLQHEALRMEASSKLKTKTANERLAEHPAQRVFIEQILEQLKWYVKLLESVKGPKPTYKKEDITGLIKIMEDLLEEKRSIFLGDLEEDMVRQEIKKMVK